MPDDFNFKYKFGYWSDCINTFDSTFTQSRSRGDTSIRMVFTKDEMKRIYEIMVINDYKGLPEQFDLQGSIQPSEQYNFTIQANKQNRYIYYASHGWAKNTSTKKKLERVKNTGEGIENILYSKEDFKRLPKELRLAL